MKTALIAVANKDGIREFAQGLLAAGFGQIVASDGTARHLKSWTEPVLDDNGEPVMDDEGRPRERAVLRADQVLTVQDMTGLPPALDHRVVTLHHKIHGGILARRDHLDELRQLGWRWFDAVIVDLYPLSAKVSDVRARWQAGELTSLQAWREAVEMMDIGGPTLIRGAVKGAVEGRYVVTSPDTRSILVSHLEAGAPDDTRLRL
ncbi:MAG: hypothetical protein COU11_03075 [Candidatus Harrisonbacteria bacterium CG10_big_fil_rev_8_21_14_0_10_49_15]|uniref:MGS-like domain-containing protein n=1 Tax=Candidatus Harrisonbacteria bacterium CG10_big_fil_rev_8_21_14_0_10_49_15 TaxID=1974587 RepID=A0A2H0UKN7_9BACT|nr:MAG: hypothetical protein COU11_03075 [Candidatus Harrisonbacteria bacterium CG10_big_fil_rev_8_21_14_0_10_49_15]